MLAGSALDVDFARDVLEDTALLDAGRLLGALEDDLDSRNDLLLEVDFEQVEMDELTANGVALLVLDDDRHLARSFDLEVE